jgi:hypothetical protein
MTDRTVDPATSASVSVSGAGTGAGRGLLRSNLVGTIVFALVVAIGLPLRDERWAQIVVGVVSMLLFILGAVCCLWGYVNALERSRTDEIGVANLFLATGPGAPRGVKRLLVGLLVAQSVIALAGAIVGAVGLSGNEVNALAFGILVPMYGLGINALWIVRHGSFGPRVDRSVQPTNRKIG